MPAAARPLLRLLLPSLLLPSLLACDPGSGGDVPDAGEVPDAGDVADAGETPDAGDLFAELREVVCNTPAPRADDRDLPSEITSEVTGLAVRATVGRIEVWGKSNLTEAKAADWGTQTCEAYAWDLAELGVTPGANLLRLPVRAVVLSSSDYARATGAGGTYGVTFSAWGDESDAFVLPNVPVGDALDFTDTLSHELTHIIQGRVSGDAEDIPWWAVEGQAVHLGARYSKLVHGEASAYVRNFVDNAEGTHVDFTFRVYDIDDETENLGEVGWAQTVSGFFVEWLRVRIERGDDTGIADAHRLVLDAMAEAGGGKAFEQAMEEMLGMDLDDAKDAYRAFIEDTVDDLDARYAGTAFAD